MSIERIEIEVREDGSRVVKRNLEAIADQAEATDKALGLMQGSLGNLSRAKTLPKSAIDDVMKLTRMVNSLRGVGAKELFDSRNMMQSISLVQQMKSALDNLSRTSIPRNLLPNLQNVGLGTDFLQQQLQAQPAAQGLTKALEDQARASQEVAAAQKLVEEAYSRVLDVANKSMTKVLDASPGVPDVSQLKTLSEQLGRQGERGSADDKARVQALNELIAAQGVLNDALKNEESTRNAVVAAQNASVAKQVSSTQAATASSQAQAAAVDNVAAATAKEVAATAEVKKVVEQTTEQFSELEQAIHGVESAFARLRNSRPKMTEMPDPEDLTSELSLAQKKLGRPGSNQEAVKEEIAALNELLQAQLKLDQVASKSAGAQAQVAQAMTQTTAATTQTTTATQQVTQAANNAAQATANLGNQAQQTVVKLKPVAQQANAAAGAVRGLAAAATSALPPSNGIVRAAKAQGGAAGGAAGNVLKLGASWYYVRRALYSLGGVLFLRELKQYSDEWIAVTNRIRIATKGHSEFLAVTQKLYEASQRTRADLGQIAKVYQRGAQASRELGATQQDLVNFTEGVGMALAIQGVNAHQAYGALHQLGQALGSARIFAEEFNSINEAAPRILQAVANNIDEASGSVARLKAMVVSGKLSNKQFFDAFMKELPRLREEFQQAIPTIGQAFTVLNNAMAKYVGETGQATGVTTGFARAVMSLAKNLDEIVKVLTVVGAAALVAFGPALLAKIAAAGAAVKAFGGAMMATPWGLAAIGITAAATALYTFRDDIEITSLSVDTMHESSENFLALDWSGNTNYVQDLNKEFVRTSNLIETSAMVTLTLGDYMRAVWEIVKDLGKSVWQFFKEVGQGSVEGGSMIMDFLSTVSLGFLNMVKGLINLVVGAFRFIVNAAPVVMGGLPRAISDLFVQAMNGAITAIEVSINIVTSMLNAFAETIGAPDWMKIPELKIGRITNEAEGEAEKFAEQMKATFMEAFTTDYVGEWGQSLENAIAGVMDKLTASAKKFAIERENAKRAAAANLGTHPGEGAPPPGLDPKEVDKVRQALRALMDSLDPIGAAFRKLNDDAETMLKALTMDPSMYDPWTNYGNKVKELEGKIESLRSKKGLERWAGSAAAMLDLLKKKMWEAMYPLEAWKRSMDQEMKLARMSNNEREVASRTIDTVNDLQSKGVTITNELVNEIAQMHAALLDANAVQEEKNRLIEEFNFGAEQQAVKIRALTELYNEGRISAEQMGLALVKMKAESGNATWTENFIAQLDLMKAGIQEFTAEAGKLFGSFVQDFSSGIADAVAQSLVHWTSLKEAIYNVATSALQALISGLIKVGIQMLLMSILGNTLAKIALASTVTTAAATATAWAPAAALASLATLGANAVPAEAAIIGTTALASGMATGSVVALEQGGYTGDVGRKQIAGIVHGQEYVVNADATKQYRPLLEAMNSGTVDRMVQATRPRMISGAQGSGDGNRPVVNISVQNNSRAKIEVEQISENDIRVIARDEAKKAVHKEAPSVIAAELRDPNSRPSRALTRNTAAPRRRNV